MMGIPGVLSPEPTHQGPYAAETHNLHDHLRGQPLAHKDALCGMSCSNSCPKVGVTDVNG